MNYMNHQLHFLHQHTFTLSLVLSRKKYCLHVVYLNFVFVNRLYIILTAICNKGVNVYTVLPVLRLYKFVIHISCEKYFFHLIIDFILSFVHNGH